MWESRWFVLGLSVDLPRSGIAADELRGLSEYAALRSEIGQAVRAAAQLD